MCARHRRADRGRAGGARAALVVPQGNLRRLLRRRRRRACAGEHSPAALPEQDAATGGALLCRTYPREPLQVTLRCEDSRIIRGGIPQRGAEVAALDPVSPDGRTVLLRLRLDPDEVSGAGVEFEPGQFVELQVPGASWRRAYSLANTANWDGEVELLIRLQPGGAFSTWLEQDARPGAQLVLHGPQGAFGLRENGMRPRWFVAGGTGLAPLVSMLRRMGEWGDPQPVRLYLGVTTTGELPSFAALPGLAQALQDLPDTRVTTRVWRPDDDWPGQAGTPVDDVARDLAEACGRVDIEDPDLYVCGPPALVDAVTAAAAAAGLPAERVHAERFLPGRGRHDRLSPGLNHLAFVAGSRAELDDLVADAPGHGRSLMFAHLAAGRPGLKAGTARTFAGVGASAAGGPRRREVVMRAWVVDHPGPIATGPLRAVERPEPRAGSRGGAGARGGVRCVPHGPAPGRG